MSTTQAKFQKGDQVVLAATVRHAAFAGLRGTVERVIKSRDEVVVRLTDGRAYFANSANVVQS